MDKAMIKKILTYAGIIIFFLVLSYGFTPEILGGKIVNQSDISAWQGMAQEAISHNKAHPEDRTAWTGSMFGGMPTTAIIGQFEGDWTQKIYNFLMTGKRPANYLFITLVGGFLLMLSMGINGIIAVAGAIAVAFCSYNMQIIQVGHNTKMQAIAFFPWVLAGVIFTYRAALSRKKEWKKWLPKTVLGAVLFALALSMQIKANHIQITYYLAIVIFIYAIALLIHLCVKKEERDLLKRFFAASALLLVIGCIGIATNANKLIPTYEYTPYTMRGGSELSADNADHNSKGLDLDYATAWSYGIEEMPNLMIPNFNGGASSGALEMDSETGKLLKRAGQGNLRETLKHMPLYWGPQPFTAGPMYIGAISIFLFMLGLFLCKGRERWWMLAATIVAVLLAWGSHFMWFTRLWFEYVPFYNKFRTVSMALIVLQVTVPLLGFYALDRIIKGKYDFKEFRKAGIIAFALTGAFCLACWLIPGIAGTFTGAVDNGQPEILIESLAADRQMLLKKDAIRSFILISVVFILILWGYMSKSEENRKGRMNIIAVSIILLICIDLIPIGKRYLNKDHFVTKRDFSSQYEPRAVDNMIHEDDDPDFRVLDLSVNTFNDAIPSYHHKTIGGYSPVKLQRYQDLIDRYISKEIRAAYDVIGKSETVQEVEDNFPYLKIVSMLNGKYVVLGDNLPPVFNPYAMGNCWFVDSFIPADIPDDEIGLLASADVTSEAVIGQDFKDAMENFPIADSTSVDEIRLTYYAPNELRYSYSTEQKRAAVFSEVYYPKGWKAWIEPSGAYGKVVKGHYVPTEQAQPADIFRADWILRGVMIPEGEGELIMRFEPDSYQVGENISRASSITLIILMLLSAAGMILIRRQ